MKLTDIQKWPKDEPDDPTPALGWMAARETAAVVAEDRNDVIWDRDTGDLIAKDPTAEAIRALPAPTPAQLLAEAMKLPEVAALVDRLAEFAARLADPDTRPNCTCRGCRPRSPQGRQP